MREFTVESEDWTIHGWTSDERGETDLAGNPVEPPMRTVTLSMRRDPELEEFMATLFKSEAVVLADQLLRCFDRRVPEVMFADVYAVAARACATWGPSAQATMVVEEFGEFLSAFAKLSRDRSSREQVIDEAADVIVVLGSAMALLGGDGQETVADLSAAVLRKIERLKKRLDAEDAKRG